jgi:TRAP-type C4-dicarboxylate transport system permease small subunit
MQAIVEFIQWCCVLNGALLLLWVGFMMFAPDLVYKTQYKWFPISRDAFAETMYRFIGLYKLLFLFFNLTPLVALKIMGY